MFQACLKVKALGQEKIPAHSEKQCQKKMFVDKTKVRPHPRDHRPSLSNSQGPLSTPSLEALKVKFPYSGQHQRHSEMQPGLKE